MNEKNVNNRRRRLLPILLFLFSLTCGVAIAASPTPRKSNPFNMLRSMSRMYVALGEYQRAISAAEKAMSFVREKSASNSDLALCMADLAWIYRETGNLDLAEQMCRDAITLQEAIFGHSHANIAYAKRILASICRLQERYLEAETLLYDSLEIMHTQLSPKDPLLAPFNADIAELLTDQGRLQEAHLLYEEVCEQLHQTYGPNHLYSSIVYRGLARLYIEKEDYDSAQNLIDDVIRVQEEVYGVSNFQMVPTWLIQAALLQQRCEFNASRELLNKSLELTRQKLGDKHPSTGHILDRLAALHRVEGDAEKAIRLADKAQRYSQIACELTPTSPLRLKTK